MKNKQYLLKTGFVLCMLVVSTILFAQDSIQPAKPKKEFIKETFEHGVMINNQTVEGVNKNWLDIIIQHRFGVIKNSDDLFGIFAPSNIRLGVNYGITKRLSVGVGATKNKRLYNFEGKYIVCKQSIHGGMPFTVSVFGDLSRSALPKTNFMNQESNYLQVNRLEYMGELMIAKKFNKQLSMQLSCSYVHLNLVDTLMKHDVIGASFIGRYKFSPQSSVQLEFDYPITLHDVNADFPNSFQQKPNLGIGYECSLRGHQFQIFICTADQIVYSQIMTYNQNDFLKKEILIGFNITRDWAF